MSAACYPALHRSDLYSNQANSVPILRPMTNCYWDHWNERQRASGGSGGANQRTDGRITPSTAMAAAAAKKQQSNYLGHQQSFDKYLLLFLDSFFFYILENHCTPGKGPTLAPSRHPAWLCVWAVVVSQPVWWAANGHRASHKRTPAEYKSSKYIHFTTRWAHASGGLSIASIFFFYFAKFNHLIVLCVPFWVASSDGDNAVRRLMCSVLGFRIR